MAPHGKELSKDVKHRIVARHKDGQGYKKISASLKVSPNTVAKVIQRFSKKRTTMSCARQGRPAKMTARTVRQDDKVPPRLLKRFLQLLASLLVRKPEAEPQESSQTVC